ncbi:hypothetical protein B0H13DRAFT_1984704 [Mycena leptocephala]|nr:hypothetical protein B0H13DRAFT_1984704 [Mycena leptocephala]
MQIHVDLPGAVVEVGVPVHGVRWSAHDSILGSSGATLQSVGSTRWMSCMANERRARRKAGRSSLVNKIYRDRRTETHLIFNPRHPQRHAKGGKQPCMPISGPRSMACTRRAARCRRRCTSARAEPSILGRKFSTMIATFNAFESVCSGSDSH